jgi:flagellar hook-basal body complex protein FliE
MPITVNPMAAAEQAMATLANASSATATGLGSTVTTGAAATAPTPFADLLTDAVSQVNQLQDQAHTAVSGLMTGSGVDVHQAMIATEKANMAFELALAVRNKAIQAYQQVIGMQF